MNKFIAFRDSGEGRSWRIRERKQVIYISSESGVTWSIHAAACIPNGDGDAGIKSFR